MFSIIANPYCVHDVMAKNIKKKRMRGGKAQGCCDDSSNDYCCVDERKFGIYNIGIGF